MKKILTATLAVAIALAPASAISQGVITGQQSYVTGSKPDAEPGKYKVLKIKKAKAGHHKRSYKVAKAPPGKYKVVKIKKAKAGHHKHSYKVAKAPHYAKHSYYRAGHHQHHWHGRRRSHHHWLLPALVGAVGLGLLHFWH
jgi:hypothetical protein